MKVRTINGVYATAKVFTVDNPETAMDDYTAAQIQMICDYEAAEGSVLRIMLDCHPGKVGPIGLFFAALNSETMLDILCKEMKWEQQEVFSCSHNYVETGEEGFILRKGAISARKGERVIIS